MFAVTATQRSDDPLAGLELGERPEPEPPEGWTTVTVRAASLNHHDVWTLRGVGIREDQLPMILGCDAAGLDEDGNEVVVHSVIGSRLARDETLDPKRSLLSETTTALRGASGRAPAQPACPSPPSCRFAEAACLPTAWLTAYRMLFGKAGLEPGATVLVQGAGGGVATALIMLGAAADSGSG